MEYRRHATDHSWCTVLAPSWLAFYLVCGSQRPPAIARQASQYDVLTQPLVQHRDRYALDCPRMAAGTTLPALWPFRLRHQLTASFLLPGHSTKQMRLNLQISALVWEIDLARCGTPPAAHFPLCLIAGY
ncbi:uncharacterized protein CANTADRAFT_107868 [Suhomyces tanzawaensis NRRL Y-17324]|uniref:Uncharacterized protein n=1 Tax=Suhomyces tanzawaensis NRRL Y-17324 TaxID=984487 RepID=A0A1E4SPJ0_9ASCO|nr:uncharacterized protein CANTADRAFT_107868 [Suhomyces tanzawaensis NRRL Y-17324]ODV81444.1 hypothetical protein CANTADRAFT_107868 [Suhomyces tanzawaensis NRRL Y-17324]